MNFHIKIARLLMDKNLAAVGRRAGVSQATMWKLRYRKRVPGIDTAAKLARALGIDVGWLVDDAAGWPPVLIPIAPESTSENDSGSATAEPAGAVVAA